MGVHAKLAVDLPAWKFTGIAPLRIAIDASLCHKAGKISAATGATAA
jgi:hypothetical protein